MAILPLTPRQQYHSPQFQKPKKPLLMALRSFLFFQNIHGKSFMCGLATLDTCIQTTGLSRTIRMVHISMGICHRQTCASMSHVPTVDGNIHSTGVFSRRLTSICMNIPSMALPSFSEHMNNNLPKTMSDILMLPVGQQRAPKAKHAIRMSLRARHQLCSIILGSNPPKKT